MRFVRRLVGLAALAACGQGTTAGSGNVSVVLDIPNAALDPMGYSSVELRVHSATTDLERNVPVVDGMFDLGNLDPITGATVDAVLRTDTGEAVGYGRTSDPMDLVAGATVTVPVRRPIVYLAGLVDVDQDGDPRTNDLHWSTVPATFSDLSAGTANDGSAVLGQSAVLMVDAGPSLFMLQQATSDPNGTLTGNATIVPVSTGNHALSAPLSAQLQGGVLDGVGTDDGSRLIIGTTLHLYVVDTTSGMATSVADGSFARVAIVSADANGLTALAIKNRTATTGTCQSTAELDWVAVNSDETNNVMSLGTGGFADVAGDRGHGYYVDACKGELGEATAQGISSKRTNLGRPTALAVSGAQAYIGIEHPGTPAAVSLVAASIGGSEAPRTLFSEPVTQVVDAMRYPGVQRQLDAQTAVVNHLEVGAGGDYVAVTLASHFHGDAVSAANFPQMDIDSEELRVLDASSAAAVERYRSWCDGVLLIALGDIQDWGCAAASGQSAPTNPMYEHKISSMTFLFGKK
jgi:hypothetical protein